MNPAKRARQRANRGKRIKRLAARYMIVDLANVARRYPSDTLRMRHLNTAIFRVRQHKLAGRELIEQAGFNPKGTI